MATGPLSIRLYRRLWLTVLASNIGTWMQTVGAQWFLVSLPNATALVALVQTADTLPDLLLALPGGALADIFDRRRFLIAVQLFQVAAGTGLTLLTLSGQMTPPLLLGFTFALGAGGAIATPAYEAMIPEIVPRAQLRSAAALASVNINLARAIGPAIAGVLIARIGVGAVFALNTITFVFLPLVLLAWRRPVAESALPPESFGAALRAGGNYVRHSPVTRRIIFRLGLFVFPAIVIWALLPLVATRRLGMDASGYGLLLGALGCGAILGALALPRLTRTALGQSTARRCLGDLCVRDARGGGGAHSVDRDHGAASRRGGMDGRDHRSNCRTPDLLARLGARPRFSDGADGALRIASGRRVAVGDTRAIFWPGAGLCGRGRHAPGRRRDPWSVAAVRHPEIQQRALGALGRAQPGDRCRSGVGADPCDRHICGARKEHGRVRRRDAAGTVIAAADRGGQLAAL